MTNTYTSARTITHLFAGSALIALTLVLSGFATSANAASYAYVTTTGEVKSVTANDWMTAILTAPGIHIHSGVLLLKSAADFMIVGDDVRAF